MPSRLFLDPSVEFKTESSDVKFSLGGGAGDKSPDTVVEMDKGAFHLYSYKLSTFIPFVYCRTINRKNKGFEINRKAKFHITRN